MLQVNEQFKQLIPSLKPEEFEQLEQNILENGIREPISLWNGTIIDGHNRYAIATKHGLPFETVSYSFDTKKEVERWIIVNQFGRRNLSAYERGELALKLKPEVEKRAKEKQLTTLIQNTTVTQKSAKREDKNSSPIETRKELAKIAGVSHDTISRVEKIQEKAEPEQIAKIKQGELSINKVYNDIRREERRAQIPTAPPKPVEGKYRVIYADPPWRYEFAETENRAIENHYPTMTLEDIKKVEVPCEENAVLFLWATTPKLEEALEVMKSWGFKYRTSAAWDKERIGMGYWFRGQHELLLLGVKGDFKAPEPANRFSSMYSEPRGQHSSKPTYYYEMIETMFPDETYLEMFAREKHSDKWEVWGNQA